MRADMTDTPSYTDSLTFLRLVPYMFGTTLQFIHAVRGRNITIMALQPEDVETEILKFWDGYEDPNFIPYRNFLVRDLAHLANIYARTFHAPRLKIGLHAAVEQADAYTPHHGLRLIYDTVNQEITWATLRINKAHPQLSDAAIFIDIEALGHDAAASTDHDAHTEKFLAKLAEYNQWLAEQVQRSGSDTASFYASLLELDFLSADHAPKEKETASVGKMEEPESAPFVPKTEAKNEDLIPDPIAPVAPRPVLVKGNPTPPHHVHIKPTEVEKPSAVVTAKPASKPVNITPPSVIKKKVARLSTPTLLKIAEKREPKISVPRKAPTLPAPIRSPAIPARPPAAIVAPVVALPKQQAPITVPLQPISVTPPIKVAAPPAPAAVIPVITVLSAAPAKAEAPQAAKAPAPQPATPQAQRVERKKEEEPAKPAAKKAKEEAKPAAPTAHAKPSKEEATPEPAAKPKAKKKPDVTAAHNKPAPPLPAVKTEILSQVKKPAPPPLEHHSAPALYKSLTPVQTNKKPDPIVTAIPPSQTPAPTPKRSYNLRRRLIRNFKIG